MEESQTWITKEQFENFKKEIQKQLINNPSNSRQKRKNKTYRAYTREDIEKLLKAPSTSEVQLRNASNYMYQVSTRYRRLIESIAGIPKYSFVISPLNFNLDRVKPESFRKAYQKVCNTIELMNIPDEARKALVIAIREGVFYGVRWKDSASSFVQKLEPDYCQISHVSDGTFLFQFDCSKLSEDKLPCYPPAFAEMYKEYQRTGNQWQLVPPDISVCLKEDPTILEYSIPPFAGALTDLYDIEDAIEQSEASNEISNYKMIHGQIALDDKGVPTITYEDMKSYYQLLCNAVGEKVGVGVSPFKITDVNFEKSGAATEVDLVARAVENYWSSVGSSAVLHGAGDGAAGVQKLSLKNEESYALALLKQYERIINRYLKTAVAGTTKFKISFLPITVFNSEEVIQQYKGAIRYGLGKSYYAASLSIPMYDISGLAYIENQVMNIDKLLTPMQTAATIDEDTEGDVDDQGGRPLVDETDLSEEGEATRESDANANR